MKIAILAVLFFVTAALYASVGFGGGSTYTAILAVNETDFRLIPILSLICNILVVSGSVINFARRELIDWNRIAPFLIFSVPLAWVGGRFVLSEVVFIGLLCIALFLAGLRLLFAKGGDLPDQVQKSIERKHRIPGSVIGGGIGFFSGLVGIGGGIFLSPILYFKNWANAQKIAATCSIFILVNSVSGLFGQLSKIGDEIHLSEVLGYWPLFFAVLIGGLLGNFISLSKFSERMFKKITGCLILIVSVRLAFRWIQMTGVI